MQLHSMINDSIGKMARFFAIPVSLARSAAQWMPPMYRLFKMKPKFTPYSVETVRSNSHFPTTRRAVNWVMPPVRLNRALRMPSAGLWSTAVWAKRPIKRQKKQRDMLLKLPGRPSRHGDDLSVKMHSSPVLPAGLGKPQPASWLAAVCMSCWLPAGRTGSKPLLRKSKRLAGRQMFSAQIFRKTPGQIAF